MILLRYLSIILIQPNKLGAYQKRTNDKVSKMQRSFGENRQWMSVYTLLHVQTRYMLYYSSAEMGSKRQRRHFWWLQMWC